MYERKIDGYRAVLDGKPGAYGVVFPDLPGCTAMGVTFGDALVNAAAAIRDWSEVMKQGGQQFPGPSK